MLFDWGWRWESAFVLLKPGEDIYGLEHRGELLGLLQTRPNECALETQRSQPLLEVELLMTAPLCRTSDMRRIELEPLYTGVGQALMRWAVQLSEDRGMEGRVGTEPAGGSDEFYARCGMESTYQWNSTPVMPWFEFTPESARAFREKAA